MFYDSQDTLGVFYRDLNKVSKISKKEEQALFKLLKDGNARARKKILENNIKFVVKVAMMYKRSPLPLPDLISEGTIGLIRALEGYDPTRGLRFVSYAVWWIRAYIAKSIAEKGYMIRIPNSHQLLLKKVLSRNNPDELNDSHMRSMLGCFKPGISLDDNSKGRSDLVTRDILTDGRQGSPDANVVKDNNARQLNMLLRWLKPRDSKIMRSLYGLNTGVPCDTAEVAEQLGLCSESIRRVRVRSIEKLNRIVNN